MFHLVSKTINQQGMEVKHKYKIIRKIGQGTFGKVYEAEDSTEKKKVAIKRVEKVSNAVSREADILKMIDHDYCLKLLDVFYTSDDGSTDNKYQNLVFDYHPTTLYRFIRDKPCTPKAAKTMFFQLCLAIHHIHEKNICHRDITPSNILLTNRGDVVLADFGSAKILESQHISMSYVCSRYYRAPELLLGCSNYTTKVDIWSAGCILAEMLLGRPLFPGADNQDQFVKIVLVLGAPSIPDLWAMKKNCKHNMRFPKIEPLNFGNILPGGLPEPDVVTDLLNGMLCYNPKNRLSIISVLQHPYFDELKKKH